MTNKTTRIGLVHATMNSVQPILQAFQTHHPEVDILNVMDETLIKELNETNTITENMIRRLIDIASKADEASVDGILFTCSSFSPYIPDIRHLFSVPTLSADESMIQQAVDIGTKIGVIATVEKAGPTTTNLLYENAKMKNKSISVETVIAPEAFYAIQKGDSNKHNMIIREKVNELDCDVILLAQFSMARALQTLKPLTTPVLTSPESSCQRIVTLAEGNS